MYALTAQNNTRKDTGEEGLMVTKETSMQKHKRLKSQAREISEYVEAFGLLAAMDRYDIAMPQTLQKLLIKGGNREQLPLVDKRAMFNTPQDYYDGIVQAIINRIVTMQATLSEREKVIDDLKAQIEKLEGEKYNRSALDMIRQEKSVSQLVGLLK